MRAIVNRLLGFAGYEVRKMTPRNQGQTSSSKNGPSPFDERWRALLTDDTTLILDVGANIGDFARMARHFCPVAKIICFEPLPSCREPLVEVSRTIGNCEVVSTAVGEKPQSAELNVNEWSASSSLLPMRARHSEEWPFTKNTTTITIDVRRLDDLLEIESVPASTVMKLDIQGFELSALKGAERVLSRVRAVALETVPTNCTRGSRNFRKYICT